MAGFSIPSGMNFGQWLSTVPGYGSSPSTPAASMQLGSGYVPGGTGTGAIFNSGLSTGYDTINGIHQTGINDYNALAAARGMPQMAMSNVDLTGTGSAANASPAAAPASSFGFNSTGNSGASGGTGTNPYLGGQANAIRNQQNLYTTDALNQINSMAGAVGGIGGTRQGVAQGIEIGMGSRGLTDSLAGLYGNAYNADQNRALSQYQGDQSFYNAERGLDQSGAVIGANLWNLGNNGAWAPIQGANNVFANYTGFGNTTGSTSQGGGATGAAGGALGTYALGHQLGWW